MSTMRVAALAVVLALVATAQPGYYPKAWVDLFQAPYMNCPEIMMSIGCLSSNVCYVPGGSNGVGFGIYKFDGKWNGNFTQLTEEDNIPIDFVLEIAVGGTEEAPHGAAGGAGLIYGLKYFVNSTTLAPSPSEIFSETQDIRTDKSGMMVLLINGMTANNKPNMLFSKDGGKTYKSSEIDLPNLANPNCTMASVQAMVDENTWYVGAGSFPPEKKKHHHNGPPGPHGDSPVRRVTEHIGVVKSGRTHEEAEAHGWFSDKKTGRVRRNILQESKEWAENPVHDDEPKCGYTAAIGKTTDGGQTWTTYNFPHVNNWTFGDIDCTNATHCVAVGSGFKTNPGSIVVRTVNGGDSWEEVLYLPSIAGVQLYMLNAIRYNPANPEEIWTAGGLDNGGATAIFYYSLDGGSTWQPHGTLNFVAEVIQMSFTPSGDGFAVGITQFDDSTIMRYTHNGPPATPAPEWGGNFTQRQCTDDYCSVNCTDFSFAQGVCLNLTGGGSAQAFCDTQDHILVQDMYPIDQTCFGPAAAQPQPLNVCIQAGNGGSFQNLCGPAPGAIKDHQQKPMAAKKDAKRKF